MFKEHETMIEAKEIRCAGCHKLLGKIRGTNYSFEIVRPRCKKKLLFELNLPALAPTH
jgi:phage FluMu protein Com